MAFWIYENWTAEKKAVIHRGECGMCNDGQGFHANPLGEKNGRWHGPFSSLEIAESAAADTQRPVRRHSCV